MTFYELASNMLAAPVRLRVPLRTLHAANAVPAVLLILVKHFHSPYVTLLITGFFETRHCCYARCHLRDLVAEFLCVKLSEVTVATLTACANHPSTATTH